MKKPIRMCIVCRERLLQEDLIRLQCKNSKLLEYSKVGRSFYLCKNCLENNNNRLSKSLAHQCRLASKDSLLKQLKEIIIYD
jgi:predicted RNA-binding protein YlxR (DUF448 family)